MYKSSYGIKLDGGDIDLKEFGLSDEELFSHVDINDLDSEKITAPRYSYWHSVFRVFFKKKINIIMLALLGVIVLMAYLYPQFVEKDTVVIGISKD